MATTSNFSAKKYQRKKEQKGKMKMKLQPLAEHKRKSLVETESIKNNSKSGIERLMLASVAAGQSILWPKPNTTTTAMRTRPNSVMTIK